MRFAARENIRRGSGRADGRATRPGESGRSRAAFSMVINVMSARTARHVAEGRLMADAELRAELAVGG